ncbi:MAG: tetratricopeptide repeat protein [Acidobacteriales bacterium]|nr:tetratricopeptide repeat protein [Terriglobales bacterium]
MKTDRLLLVAFLVLLLSTIVLCQQPATPATPDTPAASDPNDPAEIVKQGGKLSDEGKHDEALALFKQAMEAKPDLADAHLATGVTLDLKGQYDQAREHIAKAIELAPPQQKSRALRTMGMAFAFVCQPKESEKYHKQVYDAQLAEQKYVEAAGTANELARVQLECNDIAGAERWYKAGYESSLNDTKLAEKDRALWDFRWHHAQARLAARRGKKSEAKKHVAEARAALDKAQNKDQEPYFPYLTGYVAFYSKNYKTAIADLQKANQEDPFILALLAQSYEKTGDQAKAQELYRRILTFNNHNPTNAYARPLAKKKLGIGT